MSGVAARRYAQAALDALLPEGAAAVEALVEGLLGFQEAMAESSSLREVLENPVFRTERSPVIEALGAQFKFSPFAQRFLHLLVDAGRVEMTGQVAIALRDLLDKHLGRVRVRLTSAVAMGDSQLAPVKKALAQRWGCQVDDLLVQTDIDASLLAGWVCQIGDVTLDSSMRHRLVRMRDQFAAAA